MQTATPKPKQTRAIEKRNALLKAAIAEFGASGYVGTTSKSIAMRAGVATGTFYQNFQNKDQLLREVAEQRIHSLMENLQAAKLGALDAKTPEVSSIFRDALAFIYEFHKSNPELHQVLEERRHVDAELAAILRKGEDELLSRVLYFVQAFNLSYPEVVASNLFAMAEGLVHRHVFEAPQLESKLVIEQGAKMLAAYFSQVSS